VSASLGTLNVLTAASVRDVKMVNTICVKMIMIRLPSKRERKEKIKLKKTEGFPNFDFNLFFYD
jgi:hypothetical protein